MLPKARRLSLIGCLREKGNRTRFAVLSALGQVDDRIKGLRAAVRLSCQSPIVSRICMAREKCCRGRHGRYGGRRRTNYRVTADLALTVFPRAPAARMN